jgi:hypothetical protein
MIFYSQAYDYIGANTHLAQPIPTALQVNLKMTWSGVRLWPVHTPALLFLLLLLRQS